VDVSSLLHVDWQSAMAMNSSLVDDPTFQLLSFHLPWCRYLTGFRQDRHVERSGIWQTIKCVSGNIQTVLRIVDSCLLTKQWSTTSTPCR